MSPLRVVIVMLEPPLPFGNAVGRWYYILMRGLVERGHRVTAFVVCSKEEEISRARVSLFPSPDYDLRCYPLPRNRGPAGKLQTLLRPYSYMFSREFRRDLHAELASGFDILHLEQLWCGWVALPWRDRALINVHFLHEIDMEEEVPSGWRARLERWLMLSAEGRLLRAYGRFRCLSERIADRVRLHNPSAQISVGPNGLDPELYPYIPNKARTSEPVISVIGNMSWLPSHSAAVRLLSRLWPELRRRIPAARVQIVGWNAKQRERIPGSTRSYHRGKCAGHAALFRADRRDVVRPEAGQWHQGQGAGGARPRRSGCDHQRRGRGAAGRRWRPRWDLRRRRRSDRAHRSLVGGYGGAEPSRGPVGLWWNRSASPGPTLDVVEATYAEMRATESSKYAVGATR